MSVRSLSAMLALARSAIERHGGGWAGLRAVTLRSYRVLRALGWQGLRQRIRASQAPASPAAASRGAVDYPPPSPLDQMRLRVGIMIHVFYADLLDELAQQLAHMPVPYVLMLSVTDEAAQAVATARCAGLPHVQALHVRVVPNRGRDLAPFLLSFREEILALDLVCHLHTKKSLYSGQEQDRWRRYLVDGLLGGSGRIAWILGMFQAMPRLGMVYPESFASVPWWAHTWLSNVGHACELGARLGIGVDPSAYLDYPAGSMFWARTAALRPLYELDLSLAAFPPEQGQTDGTTQHAIERLLGLVVSRQGLVLGILPADGSLALHGEGERNWHAYFNAPLAHKIGLAAINAHIVSFDVFDTLAWRPFLHPSGARAYLAHLVETQCGVRDFAALRARAEDIARARHRRDVHCDLIYEALARLPEARGAPVEAMQALELATERRLLQPRPAVLEAAQALERAGKRIIAVSDMYLGTGELQRVLPSAVTAVVQSFRVSCENGWRKDSGEAWRQLPQAEGVRPEHWLHVGDNEHADVQLPQALGFIHPVHALRSGALLELVPALRSLRPGPAQQRWQDQLWLGLVANRFNELADSRPDAFGRQLAIDVPETLGYVVLGPLLLDYATWLARLALERDACNVLFLSREGHLLRRVFQRLRQGSPRLGAIRDRYLLVSRRAMHATTLRVAEDLEDVFSAPYTGPLEGLLRARLGPRIAAAAVARLGRNAGAGEVFLPEMRTQLVDLLRPMATEILDIARDERESYLAYWATQAGDGAAMVADIGYAGTIQAGLMQLTGQPLGGAYFAVKETVDQVRDRHGWACARFHDARQADDAGQPVMRHHLLLEAMLTAPDGQFSHFERKDGALVPVYSADPAGQNRWHVLERIHAGCLRFVDDVCRVTAAETWELAFDRDHVQEPLACLGSGLWRAGSWTGALGVEDHYTGRGVVAAGPG